MLGRKYGVEEACFENDKWPFMRPISPSDMDRMHSATRFQAKMTCGVRIRTHGEFLGIAAFRFLRPDASSEFAASDFFEHELSQPS